LTDTDDRRLADIRLRDALVAEDCDGVVWKRIREELAAYGYVVIMSWLRSGKIFAECRKRGCVLRPLPRDWQLDDLVTVTTDTIITAIEDFRRKAVLGGGWDSGKKASLETYYVSGCVYAFPNAYRAWRRDFDKRMNNTVLTVNVDELTEQTSTSSDPGDVVLAKHEVAHLLAEVVNPTTRRALALHADGYSTAEIADLLDTTRGSVRGLLQRLRKSHGSVDRRGGTDD
jgi:DNA-directed RNA polymerase specialized sigma24 family protein